MAASQKTVTVNNTDYTLQNPGAMWYLETLDRNRNANGILQNAGYIQDLLKNVVVDPVVTVEDFGEDLDSVMKLFNEIETFLSV